MEPCNVTGVWCSQNWVSAPNIDSRHPTLCVAFIALVAINICATLICDMPLLLDCKQMSPGAGSDVLPVYPRTHPRVWGVGWGGGSGGS